MEGTNLNGKVLTPLIDFDLIVNTDLGLIRFIRENFQDPRAFDLEIVNKSDREILSLLYSRKNFNPLSIISTKENIDDINDLYGSFMTTYKKEILKKSVSERGILQLVSMMFSTGISMGINGNVCVKDELEKEEILSHIGNGSFIHRSDKKIVKTVDSYYIKDYTFFTSLNLENDISHKKIYMSPLQYNIDYFEDIDNKLTSTNQLIFIGKNYSTKGDNQNE